MAAGRASGQSRNYESIERIEAGYVSNISNSQLNREAKKASENTPKTAISLTWENVKRLLFKTENNRFEMNGLLSWGGSGISAGGGTKKGRMKARRTVAKRCVPYFFVSFDYTADFEGFKYQAAGLPAVA